MKKKVLRPYKNGRARGVRTTNMRTVNIDDANLSAWDAIPNKSRWVNEILAEKFGGVE